MNESSSTASEAKKSNYLSLLQEIDKLVSLSTNSNHDLREISEISEIETIFNKLTENIDRISSSITIEKKCMLLITILNAIIRISTIDGFDVLISRAPFQLMFKKLDYLILAILSEKIDYSSWISDIFESMLINLTSAGFIDTCFERLLSMEPLSIIDSAVANHEDSQNDLFNFNKIIENYMKYVTDFGTSTVIQSAYQFKKNYSSTMNSLLKFINAWMTNATVNHAASNLIDIVTTILTLIWSMTDDISLIPMFVDIGYAKRTIQWTGTVRFTFYINQLGEAMLSIIYNLSRNKIGLRQLRREKAFDILMKCKQLIVNKNDTSLIQTFGITLIVLATDDEPSEENKILILNTTNHLYNISTQAAKTYDLRSEAYHLSELLELLHRAFSNTYVIRHILNTNSDEYLKPIEYFSHILLSFYGILLDQEPDELEKRVAQYSLKILLQISGYPDYLEKLIENNYLCVVIESLAHRPKQDAAKRLWFNIQQITLPNSPKEAMSSMIYISYDASEEEFCKKFVKELRVSMKIPIWVAFEHVESSDDMWESSFPIIKSATFVIVLISMAYGESPDKFQELSYIISTNKSRDQENGLIVVKTERNFHFNRYWMRDLLQHKTILSYDDHIGNLASRVREQIFMVKRPLIGNLRQRLRNRSKNASQCKDFSENSDSNIFKSASTDNISLITANTCVRQKTLSTAENSSAPMGTKRLSTYSTVSSLAPQTGSACSTLWV